jgi:uncharacterized protein YjbJ (UPF0337 family)
VADEAQSAASDVTGQAQQAVGQVSDQASSDWAGPAAR